MQQCSSSPPVLVALQRRVVGGGTRTNATGCRQPQCHRPATNCLETRRTKNWSICSSSADSQFEAASDNSSLETPTPEDANIQPNSDGTEIPDTARNAIIIGLKRYEAEAYDEALELFKNALELPGSGIKRFRNRPPEISTGERMAALYNIACCHSGKGDMREGLVALAACLEAGYDDFKQLRTDPDLEQLQQDPRFETLIQRFEPKEGLLGSIVKGFGG